MLQVALRISRGVGADLAEKPRCVNELGPARRARAKGLPNQSGEFCIDTEGLDCRLGRFLCRLFFVPHLGERENDFLFDRCFRGSKTRSLATH